MMIKLDVMMVVLGSNSCQSSKLLKRPVGFFSQKQKLTIPLLLSQALGNKLLCLKCLRESNNSFFIAWQFVPYMSIISKCIRYFIDVVVMSFVHESISSCDLTTQLGILPLSPLRDHSFCQELMTQKHGETTNYHNHK